MLLGQSCPTGCGADREGKPAGMDGWISWSNLQRSSKHLPCQSSLFMGQRVAVTCASHTGDGKTISDNARAALSSGACGHSWHKRDLIFFATDSSAAGIKAQAGRGKGNGETAAQQKHSSVSLAAATSQRGSGKDNDNPQTAAEAARKGRSWGGSEDDDGAGRSKESRAIFSWERSWADSTLLFVL